MCTCETLSPCTIVKDLDSLYTSTTIEETFSKEGVKLLVNFDFWKVLYIVRVNTVPKVLW